MNAREIARKTTRPAVATDAENRVLGFNRAARKLLGYRTTAVIGKNFHRLVEARDVFGNRLGEVPGDFREMVSRGEAVGSFDLEVRTASGDPIRVSVGVVVVLGPEAEDYNLVYQLRPILRRRKADEAIERILAAGALQGFDPAQKRGTKVRSIGRQLTRRQLEVLQLMTEGATVREMAKTIGISENTVRTHIRLMMKRLRVHSRMEAATVAYREGLVGLPAAMAVRDSPE